MVSQELLDIYERLIERKELHKEAIKSGSLIKKLGGAIILIPIVYRVTSSALKLPYLVDDLLVGLVIFGTLLLIIGQKIIDWKERLAPFSLEDEEFLNAVDSLKNIEKFQKEGIEFPRVEAAKNLSGFEKRIEEPRESSPLWEALTQEAYENVRLLKRNFKERLLPSITQSENKEEIQKAYSIIEKFANYLRNPTIIELKNLNESMLELNPNIEKVSVMPFLSHIYRHQMFIYIIFVLIGIFVYYLGTNILGIPKESAFIAGTAFVGTLAGGYIAVTIAKKT